jgi:hypothetical protein
VLLVATVDIRNYDSALEDRPGVGWMIYLPRALTVQQVPEAGALIPVMDTNKKQRGTVVVNVTGEPFSAERNREHMRIANKIEVCFVDQDTFPSYVDL